jgi:hypothetical protein
MPAEVEIALEQFKSEIMGLEGDALLDKWIEFDGSPASKEPDLGVLKSNCLEAALIQIFGLMEWRKKVAARREAK